MTDTGLRRESNQDSHFVSSDLNLYVVADGMGGHSGGEVASSIAVQAMNQTLTKSAPSGDEPSKRMLEAYLEASRKIFDKAAHENPELLGMGTTMVSIFIVADHAYIGNVGDSRCYLFRENKMWQLTEDHSLINEQIRNGMMSEADAASFTGRNVITRSVGYEREVVPDIIQRKLSPGDHFLLCSDGLSGLVDDATICKILRENPPEKAVGICLQQALDNGGDDNVTVLLVKVSEDIKS